MLNSTINLLLFPEFILSIGTVLILLIGTFLRNNSFSIISNLSIILLIFVGFIIFLNYEVFFWNYNNFFVESKLINFFQIMVILGSTSVIVISSSYFKELKLVYFEIPILILFSTLGMLLLISSNNLISMYLGIELQSLALYVIAAIRRDSLSSSESGLKYFILGALSSGILLYGCSLIYGFTGYTDFTLISEFLYSSEKNNLGIMFGLIFILVGLAFKISAVPFHMWTPDVYEGAPTSITAFFAIVPKISAIAIFYRLCIEPFGSMHSDWKQIVIFLSLSSMFLGAVAAIRQNSIKRLLAYSSIGHIGYILIGLAAFNFSGIKGAIIYIFVYAIMNIGIFSILLSLKIKNNFVEKISDLSGLNKSKPIISICIAVIMLSMAGIPPLAGFFGKFYIFISAVESNLFILAILGVVSSVIAAFYYLKIIKVIYFDELNDNSFQLCLSFKSSLLLLISIFIILFFVVYPSIIIDIATLIANDFI